VEASEGEKQQVRALRKNQMDIMKIDEWFYNEMHKLEIESSKRMAPLWNRVSGKLHYVVSQVGRCCCDG
jgi:hypothetical protein